MACFLFGFGLMGLAAAVHKADQLDASLQTESIAFSARIEDFPVTEADSVRFIVQPIDRVDLPKRLRLSWFQPEHMYQAWARSGD